MSQKQIGILGTGAYVPEAVLTNQDLEKLVETSAEWIVERSGIYERRIAAPEETASPWRCWPAARPWRTRG